MVCARRAWLLGARRIRAINDDRRKPLCQLRCGTEQVGWAKRISFSGIIAISLTFLLRTLIKAMFHSPVILQRQVGLFSAGNLRHSPTKSRRIGPTRRQDEEMMPPRLLQASPLVRRVTPRMARGLAASMFLAGGSVVAASILADDGRMEAPRWVVSAAGAAFLLAGLALIKSYVLDRGRERPGDVWGPFLGAL